MCDEAVLAGGYISGEQTGKAMEDAILMLCVQVSRVTFAGNPLSVHTVQPLLSPRGYPPKPHHHPIVNKLQCAWQELSEGEEHCMHFKKVLGHPHSRLICGA